VSQMCGTYALERYKYHRYVTASVFATKRVQVAQICDTCVVTL